MRILCLSVLLLLSNGQWVLGDETEEFFERRIRPILVVHCYECHSAIASEVKGGLFLDSRPAMLKGGESGPVLVAGKPRESLLLAALKHESLEMPPGKKLPDTVIRDFSDWIEHGAPDPRDKQADPSEVARRFQEATFAERMQWWSLQPLNKEALPKAIRRWSSAHPVDRFIHSRLKKSGLEPAPSADKVTRIRRLAFILTGLPPHPAALERFLEDKSPQAWSSAVQRMLDSDHFGEHWARHWMDVVRYTDTYGYEWDVAAKGAWRYRDYLVRAFNSDVPYDQLVREQIAGDLLPAPRLNPELGINESLVGPMFYQLGEKRHGDSSEFNGIHQEMLDNKIDALSKAFLATTVSCARCHDHKRDPITQAEYYALAGSILSSRWITNTLDLPDRNRQKLASLAASKDQIRQRLAEVWKEELGRLDLQQLSSLPVGDKVGMEDFRYGWQALRATEDSASSLAATWTRLADEYESESLRRAEKNKQDFQLIADLRQDIPPGWHLDGSGTVKLAHCGDFSVSLDSERAIESLTLGGVFTSSLSSKLNGALRTPYLNTITSPFISFQAAGGDFAAHRTVIDNAFLTEKQVYLKSATAQWQQFSTRPGMADRHIFIEYVTKTSNPNFPPRVGLGGATTAEQEADPRSWFCVSRVYAHRQAGTPADELGRFAAVYSGAPPTSLEQLRARYQDWFVAAVKRWNNDEAVDDDVLLINWLLDAKWISNNRDLSGLEPLLNAYKELEHDVLVPQTVNGMADLDPGFDYPLNVRGDYDQLGDPVPRGAPQAVTPMGNHRFESQGSGRLELARILSDRRHPLTARVYVNRIWHWLFECGIVATPSDFGQLGESPTHPELLDWLTVFFLENDWSTKKLIELVVTSHTWQQAGVVSEQGRELDPENRLLHHYPLRRLEAESIRDAMLAASGRLDRQLYGPTVNPPRANEDGQKRLFSGPLDGDGRRSIYTRITIMEPPRFLALFNQPKPKIPTGRRDTTNTPSQSLALMNDPFVVDQAQFWANRLVQNEDASVDQRLERMFRTAFARSANQSELSRWREAVHELAQIHAVDSMSILTNEQLWREIAHAVFNTKEFIYIK